MMKRDDIKQVAPPELERRNLPRLSLSSEQFRLSKLNKLFSVVDVSLHGMGLWLMEQDDLAHFAVGLEIEGILNLKREKYPIQCRVRNLRSDRVGCEFLNLSDDVSAALVALLDPVLLGAELKPIPSTEMHTLWYHGPSGTDLLLRRAPDGSFQSFIVYALGNFVQWDSEMGIKTGSTHASQQRGEIRGILRLEPLLLDADPVPVGEKLEIAKTIILSSNLSQDLKNWCARHLHIPRSKS